jgi:hypothetical protein
MKERETHTKMKSGAIMRKGRELRSNKLRNEGKKNCGFLFFNPPQLKVGHMALNILGNFPHKKAMLMSTF